MTATNPVTVSDGTMTLYEWWTGAHLWPKTTLATGPITFTMKITSTTGTPDFCRRPPLYPYVPEEECFLKPPKLRLYPGSRHYVSRKMLRN
jgi:hypothetical protein